MISDSNPKTLEQVFTLVRERLHDAGQMGRRAD
jgi:hypothetical protein